MYVSLYPGIENSMSVWSTEAIDLCIVSLLSRTADDTALRLKISNSVTTKDGTSTMVDQLLIQIEKISLFIDVFLRLAFKITRFVVEAFRFGFLFVFRSRERVRFDLLDFSLMRDVTVSYVCDLEPSF